MEMKKRSQKKKGRKADPESREVFTRLYRYLKDRMFEHIIGWENEEKGEFFIKYINLRNRISSSFFELFKAMDSISPVKGAKYRKSLKFNTEAKKRFRSNIQKLCKDNYLVERKFPPLSENLKSTKSKFRTCRYTFLKFPKSCKVQHMENIDVVLYAPTTVEGVMYASTAAQTNAGRAMCASTAAQANAGREMRASTAALALEHSKDIMAPVSPSEIFSDVDIDNIMDWEDIDPTLFEELLNSDTTDASPAELIKTNPMPSESQFSSVWEETVTSQFEDYPSENSTDASPEQLTNGDPMWCQPQLSLVWNKAVMNQFKGYPYENSTDASPEQLANGNPIWCQLSLDTSLYD